MKTVAFDTNAILAVLFKRSLKSKAEGILSDAKKGIVGFFIPLMLFAELEWVLRSVYKKEKSYIIGLFRALLAIKTCQTNDMPLLVKIIDCFEKTFISFVDATILSDVNSRQIDVFLTKDKKLEKVFSAFS